MLKDAYFKIILMINDINIYYIKNQDSNNLLFIKYKSIKISILYIKQNLSI